MRKFFFVTTLLFAAAVVAQLYLAAVGVFSDPEDELFAWHGMNGRIVLPVLAVLMIVAAALARAGRRTIWLAVLPLGLLIVQTLLFILTGVLFGLDESSHAAPPLGATLFISLHGVNGAAILIASIALVLRSRRVLREGPPAPRAERETSPADSTAAAAATESESVQS